MEIRKTELLGWLPVLADAARTAGQAIMQVYATDCAVRGKADASPVTEADERAERIIVERLRALAPTIPVVAEEAMAAGQVPEVGEHFWLVDPLDGTKEFIGRNGEFTVNIALIERGVPVLGVVLAPALVAGGRLYDGLVGQGAWVEDADGRRPIHGRAVPPAGLTVLASRSHGDVAALERFLRGRKVAALANAGSSLKLCLLAAGEADLYPRFGRTMEWDIAAGHAVQGHPVDQFLPLLPVPPRQRIAEAAVVQEVAILRPSDLPDFRCHRRQRIGQVQLAAVQRDVAMAVVIEVPVQPRGHGNARIAANHHALAARFDLEYVPAVFGRQNLEFKPVHVLGQQPLQQAPGGGGRAGVHASRPAQRGWFGATRGGKSRHAQPSK